MLAEKEALSKEEERKFAVLIRAEKAAERAAKAKAKVKRMMSAETEISRKTRNRELFQSAGLLILAGLVDGKSGLPTRDKGELLGALLALSASSPDEQKRQIWKDNGDALLSKKNRK